MSKVRAVLKVIECPRCVFGGLLAISLLSLAFALISEHVFGLTPCILCLYQRWPYVIVTALSLMALGLVRQSSSRTHALLGLLCGIAFTTGAGIAAYHVGVEQHWWEGTTACTAGELPANVDFEALRREIMSRDLASCDQISWQMFGISMAGYNALLSAGLAVVTLLSSWRLLRRA